MASKTKGEKGKKPAKKWIFLFSDTHVGSWCGLWPPGFISQSGHPLPQSKFQEWLWDCWTDALKWVKDTVGKDEVNTVFNGDNVEGIHHRTIEVMSANPDDQYVACHEVFKDVAEMSNKIFLIKGTECHSRNSEITLGARLGAVANPDTGQAAWDHLKLDVNGCICSFAHHMTATSRSYLEASAHSISLGNNKIENARAGYVVPSVVCRGHRHRHGIWNDGTGLHMSTGAWQGLTRHGNKVVPDAVPNPSVILMEFVPGRHLPIVHDRVYVPEESNVQKL